MDFEIKHVDSPIFGHIWQMRDTERARNLSYYEDILVFFGYNNNIGYWGPTQEDEEGDPIDDEEGTRYYLRQNKVGGWIFGHFDYNVDDVKDPFFNIQQIQDPKVLKATIIRLYDECLKFNSGDAVLRWIDTYDMEKNPIGFPRQAYKYMKDIIHMYAETTGGEDVPF